MSDDLDFINAAISGDCPRVVALLQAGADLNRPDKSGRTPLLCASMNGREEVIKLLLEAADTQLTSFFFSSSPVKKKSLKFHLKNSLCSDEVFLFFFLNFFFFFPDSFFFFFVFLFLFFFSPWWNIFFDSSHKWSLLEEARENWKRNKRGCVLCEKRRNKPACGNQRNKKWCFGSERSSNSTKILPPTPLSSRWNTGEHRRKHSPYSHAFLRRESSRSTRILRRLFRRACASTRSPSHRWRCLPSPPRILSRRHQAREHFGFQFTSEYRNLRFRFLWAIQKGLSDISQECPK